MSKMIQIRNVPDELHTVLKVRAAEEGMTLSDYIKRELSGIGQRPSWKDIDRRIRARGPSNVKTANVLKAIREGRGEE